MERQYRVREWQYGQRTDNVIHVPEGHDPEDYRKAADTIPQSGAWKIEHRDCTPWSDTEITDKDKVINFLDELGIAWEWSHGEIVVNADGGPKNTGYTGFHTSFAFNEDGSLTQMGAWE